MHKTINRLFYVLLCLLPINFRHIFNFDRIQYVEGFREHISWSLYAFDIIFIIFLALYLVHNHRRAKFGLEPLSILAVGTMLVVSSVSASNQPSAWYQSIRIIEAMLFFLAAKELLKQKTVLHTSLWILFLSGITQSLIAGLQFILQRSIGLAFLGESVIAPSMLGVAKIELAGLKFIRAYGTFPHPNLLGAFLLLSVVCGIYIHHFHTKKVAGHNTKSLVSSSINEFWLKLGIAIISFGLILTFSRSVWLMACIGGLIIAIYGVFPHTRPAKLKKMNAACTSGMPFNHRIWILSIGIILLLFIMLPFIQSRLCLTDCSNDSSYALRKTYNNIAVGFIKADPLQGIGPGNFIHNYGNSFIHLDKNAYSFETTKLKPWEKQPAHNIYLLVAAEIGILGLVVFLFFIYLQWKPKNLLFLYLFIAYLSLGLFDHYFWTLPQGQALFWLSLALLKKTY